MQTCFSEFQGKIILKCPKFETRWLAHASRIEARAIVLLGVHHGAFRQKELCSRRRGHFLSPTCSGVEPQAAFPRKPVGRCGLPADHGAEDRCGADDERKLWECWALCPFNRQTNDECFGLNSFKLCKAKYIHTQSQTHRTRFMACCFQQITFNETLSIINSLIVCFQKLKRLIKNNVIN